MAKIKTIIFFLITYQLILITPIYAKCNPATIGDCPAGLDEIEKVFTQFISLVVGIGFVALLVLIVWAGFKYLTSGGEQKIIQQTHQITTWAIFGIIFMAITWLILLLLENFTGVKVTVFDIKTLCGGGKWC